MASKLRHATVGSPQESGNLMDGAGAIHDVKKVCEVRHKRGSLECYFCIASRLLACKPLRRKRDVAVTNRISIFSSIAIVLALVVMLFIGFIMAWQSQEITRLQAEVQADRLLQMSLAQLSQVEITGG